MNWRPLLWLVALLLALYALLAPRTRASAPVPLLLLGPGAELAAEIQWLRFHSASLHGEEARALELAESALTLAPRANEGWTALAAYLVYDLASREREPELARRRAYFQAGLAVLARGAEAAARPGELELFRALALVGKADGDPELSPEGARGLLREALAAVERAAALGDAQAAELVPQVRDKLEAAE